MVWGSEREQLSGTLAECGGMWQYGPWRCGRAMAPLTSKLPPSIPVSPMEVGPVITSLHGHKQLMALSKMPLPPKNMHADEAGLPITAIA